MAPDITPAMHFIVIMVFPRRDSFQNFKFVSVE